METDSSSTPSSSGVTPLEPGSAPSEALTRFEAPEGFVPVVLETATKQLRYGFRAAGLGLLIRQGTGSEAVPMMPMAVIPNGPSWLLGVINLRGNLVPVCDLRRLVGGDSDAEPVKPMLLVLDKGEKAAGFLIEGYPIALNALRPTNPLSGLPPALEKHVRAMINSEEDVWLEFDHESFLEESSQ